MRVLVTGANGFIGGAAVAALRAAGHHVNAGSRRGRAPCDLDRPATLPAALAGVEAVVHCAYADLPAMPTQLANLLAAMDGVGARRLVFLSSIAVYGEAEGRIDERAPLAARDAYGAAKIACEAAIGRWRGEAAILRPGIVYGAGSGFWINKLSERIRAGAWGDFGAAGEGVAALIHIDDLTRLIVMTVGGRGGGVVNAIGPETPSWNGYFAALAKALGAAPPEPLSPATVKMRRRLSLPAKVWRRLGAPGFRALALAPTSGELALFARRAVYATDEAASLGFTPTIGLAEGLARCDLRTAPSPARRAA